MATCFVTRALPGDALARLAEQHDVDLWPERLPPSPDELQARPSKAEGLLCLLTDRVDAHLLDACPRLRAIATFAVGWDNIDIDATTARGIAVGHTPDVLTDATADLAMALLLAAARRLPEAQDTVRRGDWLTWEPAALLGAQVHGATLGIVGGGRIGAAVARRAAGFDMTVHVSDWQSGMPLEELLQRSDFVSLHCPLTPETVNLIDEAALRLMKPTAVLINTARGPIVETAALQRALEQGWIGGAALDVTDPEPLPSEHSLLRAPNLLVVPHIGSATRAARSRMADMAVDNLLAGLAGEPMPHPVPGALAKTTQS